MPLDTGTPYETEAQRWQAVQARDAGADGRFFYAVLTTGVYCRPSCAARPARRENVSFHLTCEAAERAGYRACKRCRPNGPSQAERHAAAVAEACRIIEAAEEMPALDALSSAVSMSRYHFHRIFKEATGVTPRDYAAARRVERLKERLDGGDSVTEAFHGAGFGSNGRFYEQAGALLGMKPGEWKQGGRDAAIRFALGQCSLGAVLVAATEKGICAIQFGDDPQKLLDALQDRFPQARLIGGDPEFEALVARVVGLVERPAEAVALPLDVRGTAFQQRVWKALREVPAGTTLTYGELAQRIGSPAAVRAVATACASNEIAVAIPCHRVIRKGGAMAGYRWGVARKQALLAREGVA
ncbi:bifunctional DNA-binding transcriptional regulator/O6-methylguanine-DNA methyltransferase Ada [Roseococcus sp. SYP-B2431]|uniref:bifunctional DNA-binding transcriptional regulator/O6-methylguanine-DNA methyltransferase Ada n=1 Tax=Roseococcus sp. SYP-B2431 TaxID=2496640 RepID=UPI00103C2862|nr:bifunctional DNA-binding transcriptional regulator/O6-methylguanine-DNA methyltransferase Ada [Roseococcus sp. SYP-B2431]TCH99034.1 bifunctional DNA-binding transcriptional regulator/O6-methylguanine-DNA methyltransferase Ada [Roseococcus sp. SYP-B2431]